MQRARRPLWLLSFRQTRYSLPFQIAKRIQIHSYIIIIFALEFDRQSKMVLFHN